MIKYSQFALLFVFPFVVSCSLSKQTTNKNIPSFDKWEKAVLNIESVSDRYNIHEILNYIKDRKNQNKKYSELDSLNDYNELRSQIIKVSGTAIYLSEGDNRYLVTAKHVVYDKNYTIRHIYFTRENLQQRSFEFFEKLNSNIAVKTPFSLYIKGKYNLLKIPEVNQDSLTRPFKFSNDDIDIAIISLQSKITFPLRKLLEEDGYEPISVNNIDTVDNHIIGEDLLAIGYPSFSALTKVEAQNKILDDDVVLPLTTFGKTALCHPFLYYFIADITVNPGNSGGPIIRNNKIVGIVSQQMLVDLRINSGVDLNEVINKLKSSSPLAKIIKGKFIIETINRLKIIENNTNFLKCKFKQ
jgi:hypothetical protein